MEGKEETGGQVDRLLTAAEVAERLGVKESWIQEKARCGDIPHVRLGRYRRYEMQAVWGWVAQQEEGGRRGPTTARRYTSLPSGGVSSRG